MECAVICEAVASKDDKIFFFLNKETFIKAGLFSYQLYLALLSFSVCTLKRLSLLFQ